MGDKESNYANIEPVLIEAKNQMDTDNLKNWNVQTLFKNINI